jgi:ATP-dependent Clp protease ATP-binding subunit ClpA
MNDVFFWMLRLSLIPLIIGLERTSLPLAWLLIALAGAGACLIVLIKGRYLPRSIMDILDRLSNKAALERDYERSRSHLENITAEQIAERLKSRVIAQDEVIDRIARQIRRRLAARREGKPMAVFCFAGPPGTGKTLLGKVLAETLYGDRAHLHFFDMTQFGQAHAAASLFGQARGYVGSQSYGSLTAALRDMPRSVVLLDEIEKAHPEVHKRFLTAWNDGFITEVSDGARVSTQDAIFILTTNAASRRIGELLDDFRGTPEERARLIKQALLDAQFAPEVLSRIDEVMAFRPLTGLDIARVVALEIEGLAAQYGLTIAAGGIDHHILLDAITRMQGHLDGGVRDISRAVEAQVTDGFIDARASGAREVVLTADGADIRVRWHAGEKGAPEPVRREVETSHAGR